MHDKGRHGPCSVAITLDSLSTLGCLERSRIAADAPLS